jgi:very-short-patch-repair endonuclease
MSRAGSALEETLALHIRAAGLPTPDREVQFQDGRRWRFDFAWPARMVALEVEGGVWTHGRHTRPKGFTSDCHKYNAATLAGWRVLRVTGDMIRSGDAIAAISQAMAITDDIACS